MMKRFLIAALLLLGSVGAAFAQTAFRPCVTIAGNACPVVSESNPLPVTGSVTSEVGFNEATTTQAKATVAVTNTFQAALAASATRKGCTLQYIAVAGTVGYVFFGSGTPADLTTSWQLVNRQSITCAIAGIGVATDQVLITGTGTDIFIVSNQ